MRVYRHGMMNRIAWFVYLRTAFDNSTRNPSHPNSVFKYDFIKKLLEFQQVVYLVN